MKGGVCMKIKRNIEIREAMRKALFPQWKLAELMGVCENTVNRWLRTELPADKKNMILQLIEDHKEE